MKDQLEDKRTDGPAGGRTNRTGRPTEKLLEGQTHLQMMKKNPNGVLEEEPDERKSGKKIADNQGQWALPIIQNTLLTGKRGGGIVRTERARTRLNARTSTSGD